MIGKWESVPVFLNERFSTEHNNVPSAVQHGVFQGYSMPIWLYPERQHEELFFSMRIPDQRWDDTVYPIASLLGYICQDEASDSNIKLEMEVSCVDYPDKVHTTTVALTDEVNIGDRNEQYDTFFFRTEMPLPPGSTGNVVGRLRRVAASSNDIAGEFVILHWDSEWFMKEPYRTICEYLTIFT